MLFCLGKVPSNRRPDSKRIGKKQIVIVNMK